MIEVNFNLLEIVEQGNVDILKEWYVENNKKQNYDGTYTYNFSNGYFHNYKFLHQILHLVYQQNCKSRWNDPVTAGYPNILQSAKNSKEMICFLMEKSFDTYINESDMDGRLGNGSKVSKSMSQIIYDQSKEISLLKTELNKKNLFIQNLLNNKNKNKKIIEDLHIQIDEVNKEKEKLKKEINKKEQIIEKYHNRI